MAKPSKILPTLLYKADQILNTLAAKKQLPENQKNPQNIGMLREQAINQIQKVIEDLPGIEDDFLELFNLAALWQMPADILAAFGAIAAQSLDFNQQTYADLSHPNVSPVLQLNYLLAVALNPFDLLPLYEWVAELQKNPYVMAAQGNTQKLINELISKLMQYTYANLELILQINPHFKIGFLNPELSVLAKKLQDRILTPHLLMEVTGQYTFQILTPDLLAVVQSDKIIIINMKTGKQIAQLNGATARVIPLKGAGGKLTATYMDPFSLKLVWLSNTTLISYKPNGQNFLVWDLAANKAIIHEFINKSIVEVLLLENSNIIFHCHEDFNIITGTQKDTLYLYNIHTLKSTRFNLNGVSIKDMYVLPGYKILIIDNNLHTYVLDTRANTLTFKWQIPLINLVPQDAHHMLWSTINVGIGQEAQLQRTWQTCILNIDTMTVDNPHNYIIQSPFSFYTPLNDHQAFF